MFSGGLDSSLLLALGREALGPGLTALTLIGPHTAPGEVAAAWQLTQKYQVRHLLATFDPLSLPDFRENTLKRCYVCKQAIAAQAQEVAVGLYDPGHHSFSLEVHNLCTRVIFFNFRGGTC